MTDHPVTTPEPWPGWLADLTPEDRVTAIVSAVVNCYRLGQRGHESADPGEQHCTATMAHAFLLRLLGEARQQAPVPSADLGDLRERIGAALQESPDFCGQCRPCRAQLDAIMSVLGAEQPRVLPESLAADRLTVAVAALHRLALDEPVTELKPGNHAWLALEAEMTARREHAAGTLETVRQLGEMPERPEPLTHFTTAGQSRLAADNFPACEAVHWAIVSPYVRQVTCDDCLTWLGSAVGNLTRALANAAATIERRDADLAEPDPLPPGFFGRVELPGFRNYTGWITQDGADRIVSDWDGNVLAEYQPGPNCLTIHLPTPQKRPEPQKAIAASSGYGDYEPDDDDPWGSDGDDG